MNNPTYDLIVVGGGAAGVFAAITFAEESCEPRRILILEKAGEVLRKVKISGGGRCNVTHDCHDPREFARHYPAGEKTLPGPLHRWSATDMIDWFSGRGIELKSESDGRIFPVSDSSQTIIDCFLSAAKDLGIEIRCRREVVDLEKKGETFFVETSNGETVGTHHLMISTGGVRTPSGARFAERLGHTVASAAPSLFTFKIKDSLLTDLAGISVSGASASIDGTKLSECAPLLITHWGLSGPGILKLSARGARLLQEKDYRFTISVNWTGRLTIPEIRERLIEFRNEFGKRRIHGHAQFSIPVRLWRRICEKAEIDADLNWGNLDKSHLNALTDTIGNCPFSVEGKSMNKDEFVTCGGVNLKEINFKSMESRLCPGLYFAGEVLDIDGVTGGFNFQSAWTTARIAGQAMASK